MASDFDLNIFILCIYRQFTIKSNLYSATKKLNRPSTQESLQISSVKFYPHKFPAVRIGVEGGTINVFSSGKVVLLGASSSDSLLNLTAIAKECPNLTEEEN